MMKIYTLGTSNRSFDEFVEILKGFGIEVVIDIRRFPTSKFEHFKKENLDRELKEKGIGYEYIGDLLGGYREGGYGKYMESEDFKRGIKRLKEIAEKRKIVLICKERFPWKCHRWHVARKLVEDKIEVVHIIEKEKVYVHKCVDA